MKPAQFCELFVSNQSKMTLNCQDNCTRLGDAQRDLSDV